MIHVRQNTDVPDIVSILETIQQIHLIRERLQINNYKCMLGD